MRSTYRPLLLGFLLVLSTHAQELSVGSIAPDFSLPYATRDSIAKDPVTLSDIVRTSSVLIAFYPADWSSGCTKEVCGLRDDIESLSDLGVAVLAVSGDYVYSHHEWAKHHNLPFRLLSDHDHAVARSFNSFNPKNGMNTRSVFVVNQDRTIVYLDAQYSVRDEKDYILLKQALKGLR